VRPLLVVRHGQLLVGGAFLRQFLGNQIVGFLGEVPAVLLLVTDSGFENDVPGQAAVEVLLVAVLVQFWLVRLILLLLPGKVERRCGARLPPIPGTKERITGLRVSLSS